ncbi:hypothetical protein CPB86DRAFT_825054 [Serendipita vermifera]|nr:hypothetical protein CPB86DRAFT_825054 [Serendipita vermifera]
MCPNFPSMLPLPLLTLNLSSTSYLDTVLYDAASHCLTSTNQPKALFSVETRANTTTLYRADPTGLNTKFDAVADIQWPTNTHSSSSKSLSAARVTILNGQPQSAGSFLKKTVLGGSRKYHIPGQPNPLKWKRVAAGYYECTLCSHACTSHRAVATFEPSSSFAAGTWGRSKRATSIPSRLSIYTSSVSQHQEHIVEEYQGVDVLLIVYLIVSSILLTTPVDAWMNTFQSALSPVTTTAISPVTRTTSITGTKRSNSSSKEYSAKPKIDLLETGPTELYSYPPSSKSSPHVHIVRSLFHTNNNCNTNNSHIITAYGSPASSTSSSHHSPTSSLPASPITPNVELSPITNETFATSQQSHYTVYNNHYHCGPPPTPIVTTTRSSSRCSSLNGFGGRRQPSVCSSSQHPSPYISTRELSHSSHSQPGPNAITPYHLPPAPTHAPPALPRQAPSPTSARTPTQQTLSPPSPHHYHHHNNNNNNNNALLLDTTLASPVPYTSQMYNAQFGASPLSIESSTATTSTSSSTAVATIDTASIQDDELPPAYNEIEWTVKVRQPRMRDANRVTAAY